MPLATAENRPATSRLPIELVHQILVFAAAFPDTPLLTPDYATLRSTSLVAKAWSVLSQELLWSHVYLPRDRISPFDSTLIVLDDDADPSFVEKSARAARRRSRVEQVEERARLQKILNENSGTRWIKGSQARRRRLKGASLTTKTLVLNDFTESCFSDLKWVNAVGYCRLLRVAGPGLRRLALGHFLVTDIHLTEHRLAAITHLDVFGCNMVAELPHPIPFHLTTFNVSKNHKRLETITRLVLASAPTLRHLRTDPSPFHSEHSWYTDGAADLALDPAILNLRSLNIVDMGALGSRDPIRVDTFLPHLRKCSDLPTLRLSFHPNSLFQMLNKHSKTFEQISGFRNLIIVVDRQTWDPGPNLLTLTTSLIERLREIGQLSAYNNLSKWKFEGVAGLEDGDAGVAWDLLRGECAERGTELCWVREVPYGIEL
ncbi:hypothetical protein P7C70_g982, partial [Phenoliferia sp. Uapishka_3]